ncbi:hypothetical protein ACKWTF_013256 [Chironomus riparius]
MRRQFLLKFFILLLIFAIFTFIQISNAAKPKQSLLDTPRFKSVSCNYSDDMLKMIYSNSTCKVIQIDKRIGAITLYVLFKQPIHAIIVIIFKGLTNLILFWN